MRTLQVIISGGDCTKLDSAWNQVETEPALPVVENTDLILNCPGGYTNLGGDKAICLYGQVILTDKPPDCRGKSNKNLYGYRVTLTLTPTLALTTKQETPGCSCKQRKKLL